MSGPVQAAQGLLEQDGQPCTAVTINRCTTPTVPVRPPQQTTTHSPASADLADTFLLFLGRSGFFTVFTRGALPLHDDVVQHSLSTLTPVTGGAGLVTATHETLATHHQYDLILTQKTKIRAKTSPNPN